MKNIYRINNSTLKVAIIFLLSVCCFSMHAQNGGFPVWPLPTMTGTKFLNMQNGNIIATHNNSTIETAAAPGFACGELAFYVKHTGGSTVNQLEIFSKNGTKLLGATVAPPNNIGLNASMADYEIQVVQVPSKQNEWFIIYNKTPTSYNPSPFTYLPSEVLYSRIRLNCCDNTITVIERDIHLQQKTGVVKTYRTGKALSRLSGSKHFLYLFQRDNYFVSNSGSRNLPGNFTIDRYEISSTGIGNCQSSQSINDTTWFQETIAIELKPNDEIQLGVLKRNQGEEGNNQINGCNHINTDSVSYKPLLYLFTTNQNTTIAPTIINQSPIDFTTLKITGLTLGGSPDLSIREYCGNNLSQSDNRRYLQNFWRKLAAIEFSPDGQFIYVASGGFVQGGSTNLTYLGQIRINNNQNQLDLGGWIRLQCQNVSNSNNTTGVGNSTSGNNNDRMISDIESATNGMLYFTKLNCDTLFAINNPNDLMPVDFSRHNVNFSNTANIKLGSASSPTGLGGYVLLDQIDRYTNYLPNGQNPSITGIPTSAVMAGTPITISTNPQTAVSWSVTPAATLTPLSGVSTNFVAQQAGEYIICAENMGCCIRDTIIIIPGNPPSPCCDIATLAVSQPINLSVNDYGNYFGFNYNLPINTGSGLFEELRTSLVNFELEYSETECAKCYNHFSYMGTFLLQSSPLVLGSLQRQSLPHYFIGTAIPNSSPAINGVREIIWKGLPAHIGNVSPQFEILFPKPILPNCCNVKVKACMKLVFKDVNCDICEKYVCFEFNTNDVGINTTINAIHGDVNNYGINCEGIKRTIAPSVNNYGINDEGIKRTTLQTFTSVNSFGMNDNQLMRTGEPVRGAEIYIELEPDEEPIINVTTNENGEFNFETADVPNFPQSGIFSITVVPSRAFAKSKNIPVKKQKIKVRFKTPKNGKFEFILFWEQLNVKAQNKGSFAVSGKNST